MIVRSFLLSPLLVAVFAVCCIGSDAPIMMESVRSMSMGSAAVAVADDENLLFFNPAGLTNIKDSKLTTFSLVVKFNPDAIRVADKLISSYSKVKDFRRLSKNSVDKLRSLSPLLSLAPARLVYVRPHLAVAFLNTETNMKGSYSYYEEESIIKISGHGDAVMMLAMGSRVFRKLSLGGTLKYAFRFDMKENDANALLDYEPTVPMGRGLGLDMGLLWTEENWRLGLSIRDVIGTKITGKSGIVEGEWDRLERQYTAKINNDFTLGFFYRSDWKLPFYPYIPRDLIFAADIGGLWPVARNLHLGAEARILRWLAVRIGMNAGLRIGVGLRSNIWVADFMYATKLRDEYLDRVTSDNFCLSVAVKY